MQMQTHSNIKVPCTSQLCYVQISACMANWCAGQSLIMPPPVLHVFGNLPARCALPSKGQTDHLMCNRVAGVLCVYERMKIWQCLQLLGIDEPGLHEHKSVAAPSKSLNMQWPPVLE